jgi:hypothetical protein
MKKKKQYYAHHRGGDFVKVEIRDETYRKVYKAKFNIRDKNALLSLIKVLEKFSGFSVLELIKIRIREDEWF